MLTSAAGAAATDAGSSATAGVGVGGEAGESSETCSPGRAPLRRLTRAEYVSSVTALFGDVTSVTAELPPDNRSYPVGNRADDQSVGFAQAKGYAQAAKQLAQRATGDLQALTALAACAAQPQPGAACARTVVERFASKAFRRAPSDSEVDELVALHGSVLGSGGNFAQATAAVIAAILQAPDFLYRIEWGTSDGPRSDVRRLTGEEMAVRLSYLFWGSPPDEALRAAAQSGALLEADGIAREAARLFDDPRSHAGLAAFFEDYLELYRLPELTRSDPAYSVAVGVSLQRATQRFLEAQIFEQRAAWPAVLTADKAFVDALSAPLFGMSGIDGDQLQEVALDRTQRLGLLTQPAVLMTHTFSNVTSPVHRGHFMMEKVLCRHVGPEPPLIPPTVGTPPSGPQTARQRLEAHSEASCAQCHRDMDQLGFALENYDALGRYRTQDQGLNIDAMVDVAGVGPTNGPVELVTKLSMLPETQTCFAVRVAEFGLGKLLDTDSAGACLKQQLASRFEAAGYSVRELLLALTQTDAFLYLPKEP